MQGYAISRRNTKTLVVELPYGVQDFDEFVLDMRLHYGCKMDYDLTETTGKTIEIRITPGAHEVVSDPESDTDIAPAKQSATTSTPRMHPCCVLMLYVITLFSLLLAVTIVSVKLFPAELSTKPTQ